MIKLNKEKQTSLSDKYIIPPISIFDTRQGYWKKRKKFWDEIGLYSDNGRSNVLSNKCKVKDGSQTGFKNIAPTTSKFDPVLTEIVYKWFTPCESDIIDPFAGGVTRGGVAYLCGHRYTGIDLSNSQICSNVEILSCLGYYPDYICDDSDNIDKYFKEKEFDLLFSCPPYFNLEKYSNNKQDLSNMEWDSFVVKYQSIIYKSCRLLKDDRFAVFVVGDVRDKQGNYYLIPEITIDAFVKAGLKLYNRCVLLEQIGTKAMTCERPFLTNRKVTKAHQSILVFYKGNIKNIRNNFSKDIYDIIDNNRGGVK